MPSVAWLSLSCLSILGGSTVLADANTFALGFNYGALNFDKSPRFQADFEKMFRAAKAMPGISGYFTSAKLYTMIVGAYPRQIEQNDNAVYRSNPLRPMDPLKLSRRLSTVRRNWSWASGFRMTTLTMKSPP